MSAIHYHETIWSDIYPGNRHTVECLQPAVLATETALALSPAQRKRTVWRLDGGAGSDEHLRWLLACDYHVLAKGISNRRAVALARQVRRWDAYQDAWLGEVAPPTDYGRPVRVFVKRRRKNETFCYSSYLSTLALSAKSQFMAGYDDRGGAEVEQFRNDKSGLSLEARRKHSFVGQKGYILLTDLAHNLLADFQHRAFERDWFRRVWPETNRARSAHHPRSADLAGWQIAADRTAISKPKRPPARTVLGKVLRRRLKPIRNRLCLRQRIEMPCLCAKIRPDS